MAKVAIQPKHGAYGQQHWTRQVRLWQYDRATNTWNYYCPMPGCGLLAIPYPYVAAEGFDIDDERLTVYPLTETCSLDCSQLELYTRQKGEIPYTKALLFDEWRYLWCGHCKKILRNQLVQCPECDRYFRGPRRFFPADYECPECE